MGTVNIMSSESNYHHGSLRAALLKAAFKLLDKDGIDAVTIRQIARVVGVAHSAPANHFKNKRELFTALALDIYNQLSKTLTDELKPNEKSLRKSIHAFSKIILDFGLKHPNRYILLSRRDCFNSSDEALYKSMEEVYQHMIRILSSHSNEKSLDTESQAIALWSMIHGYVTLRLEGALISGSDELTGEDRQIAIIDVIINGLM
jgi:AcrR family transcriptional regulator